MPARCASYSGSFPSTSRRRRLRYSPDASARTIGKDDPEKYLGAVEILFKLQDRLVAQTKDTLFYVGRMHGMSVEDVETCEKDQSQFDKLSADQQYAAQVLKVTSTPTFFINGARIQGALSFEEFEERIKPLLNK
jgi:protein-disulfide isomerase